MSKEILFNDFIKMINAQTRIFISPRYARNFTRLESLESIIKRGINTVIVLPKTMVNGKEKMEEVEAILASEKKGTWELSYKAEEEIDLVYSEDDEERRNEHWRVNRTLKKGDVVYVLRVKEEEPQEKAQEEVQEDLTFDEENFQALGDEQLISKVFNEEEAQKTVQRNKTTLSRKLLNKLVGTLPVSYITKYNYEFYKEDLERLIIGINPQRITYVLYTAYLDEKLNSNDKVMVVSAIKLMRKYLTANNKEREMIIYGR